MAQIRNNMLALLKAEDIRQIVSSLAAEIEKDYEGKTLTMICPLKGSILFFADLSRSIRLPQIHDFVYLTSPKGESVRILKDISINLLNQHVLIIEEIVDAGRTLDFLKKRIQSSQPASLKVVTLLDKPARRQVPVSPDYIGKTVDDRYLIGYGLDSEEIGRNYRDIYSFVQ